MGDFNKDGERSINENFWKKYGFCKLRDFLIWKFKIPLEKIINWSLNFNEFTKLPFCNDLLHMLECRHLRRKIKIIGGIYGKRRKEREKIY